MRTVSFSKRAERDLREILEYLAEENPRHAIETIDRLEVAALELGTKALNYQRVPDVSHQELRRRVVSPYNIYYSTSATRVEIVLIAHGARDTDRLLLSEH